MNLLYRSGILSFDLFLDLEIFIKSVTIKKHIWDLKPGHYILWSSETC